MRMALRSGIALAGIWLALGPAVGQQPAAGNPSEKPDRKEAPPLVGANSFSEGQARHLIESKGYADVSPLMNDGQGIWRGTASKGAAKVHVSVDFKGNVTARQE